MQRPRHQFLAGATFTGNHDREVGSHEAGENAIDILHRRRAADQRQLLFRADILGGGQRGSSGHRQRTLNDVDQLAQIEWFRQIFERTAFGRLDRRH